MPGGYSGPEFPRERHGTSAGGAVAAFTRDDYFNGWTLGGWHAGNHARPRLVGETRISLHPVREPKSFRHDLERLALRARDPGRPQLQIRRRGRHGRRHRPDDRGPAAVDRRLSWRRRWRQRRGHAHRGQLRPRFFLDRRRRPGAAGGGLWRLRLSDRQPSADRRDGRSCLVQPAVDTEPVGRRCVLHR